MCQILNLFQLKICSTIKLVLMLFLNLFQKIIKNRKKNWRSSLPGPVQPESYVGGPKELLCWKRRIGAPYHERRARARWTQKLINEKPKEPALMGHDLYPSARGRSEQRRARELSIGIASWTAIHSDWLSNQIGLFPAGLGLVNGRQFAT
jgi:hypothetical protein